MPNIEITRQAALDAKQAARKMAALEGRIKDRALARIVETLRQHGQAVADANQRDLELARSENLAAPLLKRLRFDAAKIEEACQGLESLISLPDPVGVTLSAMELDQGLELYKVTCPIGVVGVIFESRPDALVQISALCLKSGNAVLLKGGSEAARTNRMVADMIAAAAIEAGVPAGWLHLLETRAQVTEMLALDQEIDLIIPRGSNAFVRHIMEHSNIPVLGHADGICHLYVDAAADLEMAVALTVDSKCQYVAVCNALETLLVDQAVAETFLPRVAAALRDKAVEIRGCPETRRIIDAVAADESDWRTEYLDRVLAVKVVADLDAAVDHIHRYGSGHTEVIVTSDPRCGARFLDRVDAANVFVNCSSRFSDGFRFGLGAEVGISTSKIHARGPVGLEGLTIYKWRLLGNGHRVASYCGADARPFRHRRLNKPYPRNA
jgi:glutamate-5-semialdehyde dehydrogenase